MVSIDDVSKKMHFFLKWHKLLGGNHEVSLPEVGEDGVEMLEMFFK